MMTLAFLLSTLATVAGGPFRIQFLDDRSSRPVPLVELETVNHIRYVTDSNGLIAIAEPELWGEEVYFWVHSHGYEYPADGFGMRGIRLKIEPGGNATIKIKRINIAERLYRLTGAGIYRDSLLVGEKSPISHPLLNAKVLGSDSVQNALFGGRLLWFWGDTNRPAYPLGNFHTPGAYSNLPGQGGLDPSTGVDLMYETDPETGFAVETARMEGEGPTWISGLTVLKDHHGLDRLFCGYVKVRPPMEVYRHGLAEWDDQSRRWRHVATFPEGRGAYPDGHPFHHKSGDTEYVYFPTPYPVTRVPARIEAFSDPSQYEVFTCLEPGSKPADAMLERDHAGRPVYQWRKNAFPLNPENQQKLLNSGILKPDEALLGLRDVDSGQPILAHGGSVCWNDYRKRWVMIFVQAFGKPSFLGELWYAEADTPLGPWAYTRKIVTHDDYSFYNPKQHPYFDQEGGRLIYFEGTYTQSFSGNKSPTPRYDYNQIMYRLDLSDVRLNLPVAFYRDDHDRIVSRTITHSSPGSRPIAFFAPDRQADHLVPVYLSGAVPDSGRLTLQSEGQPPLFFAKPDPAPLCPGEQTNLVTPLYEWTSPAKDRYTYRLGNAPGPDGWTRSESPLVHVWRVPGLALLPFDL